MEDMKRVVTRKLLAGVLVFALASPVVASSVSVSPGGSTNLSGQMTLGVTSSDGNTTLYSVSCAVNATANLNPADASFTISSVSFAPACGLSNGSTSWAVTAGSVPWHGATTYNQSPGPAVQITGAEIFVTQVTGFSPAANFDCRGTLSNLYWTDSGAQLKTMTGVTGFPFMWHGLPLFGSSGTARCYATFSWYVSPFQTFTLHP